MDILADILKQAGLRTRLLNQRSFDQVTALKFPCSKSIGFHVVTHGEAFLQVEGKKTLPIHLQRGDIALMARGCSHVISTESKIMTKMISPMDFQKDFIAESNQRGPTARLTLVSGAYQFWNEPIHPFFRELPDWSVIRGSEIDMYDQLQSMIKLLSEEVSSPQIGSESIVQGLLDILFSLIVRRLVFKQSAEEQTWSHAICDQQIYKALELMHSEINRVWTLEDLAHNVGLSRAGFAQKFKQSLGDTPLHYLTNLRMQKAMELLSTTSDQIEIVALAVGYQDAFGFSKVFKKVVGIPPREFRIKDREDRQLAWRL